MAFLMPQNRLALVVQLGCVTSSEGSIPDPQQSVNLPSQPWPLISPSSDGLSDSHVVNVLGDVGWHSFSVLQYVSVLVVCGCLLEHGPVSGVKAVLQCRGGTLRPHTPISETI